MMKLRACHKKAESPQKPEATHSHHLPLFRRESFSKLTRYPDIKAALEQHPCMEDPVPISRSSHLATGRHERRMRSGVLQGIGSAPLPRHSLSTGCMISRHTIFHVYDLQTDDFFRKTFRGQRRMLLLSWHVPTDIPDAAACL